jgi:hypothetical protein
MILLLRGYIKHLVWKWCVVAVHRKGDRSTDAEVHWIAPETLIMLDHSCKIFQQMSYPVKFRKFWILWNIAHNVV